eukprot:279620-Amphidinium_carterae.1
MHPSLPHSMRFVQLEVLADNPAFTASSDTAVLLQEYGDTVRVLNIRTFVYYMVMELDPPPTVAETLREEGMLQPNGKFPTSLKELQACAAIFIIGNLADLKTLRELVEDKQEFGRNLAAWKT